MNIDSSNYATKTDLKIVTGIDISNFPLKLDIDKLIPVSVDMSKLNDAVKIGIVKRTVYDKLVAKLNNIDTSGFVLKTKYDTHSLNFEKNISNTSGLVKQNRLKC